MKGQPPKSAFPLEQGTSADSRGTVVPRPATLGSRARQSYIPVAGLAGARLHLHGRGEETRLSPGKAFSWQEKKGKLSAQKAEHRRFNQQESLLIQVTWDLGEKGKRRAGTQSGFFFLLPKLLWGMVGRVERERAAWHKDTVQTWCQLGTLEYWVAGWEERAGASPQFPVDERKWSFQSHLLSESEATIKNQCQDFFGFLLHFRGGGKNNNRN